MSCPRIRLCTRHYLEFGSFQVHLVSFLLLFFHQVMNVNLLEGDKVAFEDVGLSENTMLANETILMRGLVVRSHSNQLSIRLYSQRPQAGSVFLRYQGKN